MARGKVLGLLNLVAEEKRVYPYKEIAIFLAVCKELGTAIARMQTDEALKTSEEKYRELVENAGSIILRLNPAGEITFFNEFAQKFFGISDTEILGKNIIGTIIPDRDSSGKDLSHLVANIISDPKGFASYETEVINQQTQPMWVTWTNKVMTDSKGQVTEIMCIGTDITERKKLEENKDEFVGVVSHELRTPLMIVREGICLIIDGIVGKINEQQAKLLNTARENLDRLSRIIDSLLDVSRIEAGKIKLKKELVNLNELVNKVISNFQLKTSAKNLEIRTVFSSSRLEVLADYDKMVQVFTNLLDNAIKFSEKGWIVVAIADNRHEAICSVADTGVGIEKSNLSKLFSKFEQFGRRVGSGSKGAGLGLSIAKGIVEKHGGRIWAESELGKETKFTFTIPKGGGE